jgi:hypothetical protein
VKLTIHTNLDQTAPTAAMAPATTMGDESPELVPAQIDGLWKT